MLALEEWEMENIPQLKANSIGWSPLEGSRRSIASA